MGLKIHPLSLLEHLLVTCSGIIKILLYSYHYSYEGQGYKLTSEYLELFSRHCGKHTQSMLFLFNHNNNLEVDLIIPIL